MQCSVFKCTKPVETKSMEQEKQNSVTIDINSTVRGVYSKQEWVDKGKKIDRICEKNSVLSEETAFIGE